MMLSIDIAQGVVKHEGVSITTNQYGKSTEQKVEISFIPESDVYRLIMRSKLPEAEKFQDWVCEEILPAIRKTGGYMVAKADETPEEIMARALLVAQDTMKRKEERIQQLERKVETVVKKTTNYAPRLNLWIK
ncbi:MAG: Bro-N domain-containing protein [Parabacteroides merdae]